MYTRISAAHVLAAGLAMAAILFAIGWVSRENRAEQPFLTILGGGFVVSYPITDFYYGFTAKVDKPLTTGSIIEAEFQDPAGGPPLMESIRVSARTTRYSLRSPSVSGVVAGRPYRVVIRLYDFRHEKLIEKHERHYTSTVSDWPPPPDS